MKLRLASLVFGALLITGMVGCSETAKPVEKPVKIETKSEEQLTQEYMTVVKEVNTKSITAFNNIKDIMDRATANPNLFDNEQWRNELKNEYNVIEDSYFTLKRYKELDIPFDLLNGHRLLLSGYENAFNGNNYVYDGIKEHNKEKMQYGVTLMKEGAFDMRASGLDKYKN